MKKFLSVLCTTILVLSLAGIAGAATYEFSPNDGWGDPDDLWDLDHHKYFTWGIDLELSEGETISSASLSFTNIINWYGESTYDLWGHLLDSAPLGAEQYPDYQGGGNFFDGEGLQLFHWDENDIPQDSPSPGIDPGIDLTYSFDADPIALATLNSYVTNDGIFGLGFDPDCHFWNDGITLNIKTVSDPVIPEPSTILLVGLGLVGLIGLGGKRFKK